MRGVVFLVLRPFCNAFAICATILPYLAHWYDDPENFPFRNSRKDVSPVRPFSLRLYAPRVRKNDFPSKGWRLTGEKGVIPAAPGSGSIRVYCGFPDIAMRRKLVSDGRIMILDDFSPSLSRRSAGKKFPGRGHRVTAFCVLRENKGGYPDDAESGALREVPSCGK